MSHNFDGTPRDEKLIGLEKFFPKCDFFCGCHLDLYDIFPGFIHFKTKKI